MQHKCLHLSDEYELNHIKEVQMLGNIYNAS